MAGERPLKVSLPSTLASRSKEPMPVVTKRPGPRRPEKSMVLRVSVLEQDGEQIDPRPNNGDSQ